MPPVGEAAVRDRPGGEAEIGLRLAAAGREEQQVDDLAVGVQPVVQAGEVEQDEGELERSPFRRPAGRPDRRRGPPSRWRAARATASFIARKARRACGSRREQRDAVGDAIARVPRRVDQALRRRLPRRAGDAGDRGCLRRDPRLVLRRQASSAAPQRVGSGPRQLGERLHPELDVGDLLVRLDALDLGGRQVVGARPRGRCRPDRPFQPAEVFTADRVLADIAVVQVGERRVDVRRAVAAQIGARMKTRLAAHSSRTWNAKVTS